MHAWCSAMLTCGLGQCIPTLVCTIVQVKFAQQNWHDKLSVILEEFPKVRMLWQPRLLQSTSAAAQRQRLQRSAPRSLAWSAHAPSNGLYRQRASQTVT